VAIKPLLRNINAPISVSVGAVQLLSHLHMRLEVLVKDDYEEEAGYDNSDTPVLWEVIYSLFIITIYLSKIIKLCLVFIFFFPELLGPHFESFSRWCN
jgi:hypothetical protein